MAGAAFIFVSLLGASLVPAFAQEPVEVISEEEEALQDELTEIAIEIAKLREELRGIRQTQDALEDEILAIKSEIERTELSIRRSEVAIESLGLKMSSIQSRIVVFEENVKNHQRTLSELIRSVAERDDVPPVAIIFSGGTLSDIANQIEEERNLQDQLLESIQSLRGAQEGLLLEEAKLLEQQTEEEEARTLLVIEREELLIKQELEKRLKDSVEEEAEITRREISVTELDAAKIRRQLFPVAGEGEGLTFEEAYLLVKPLAELVGIRPAFVLAILQKETHFGALKGTGHWRIDMHPRDWDAFLEITSELGLNPDEVPVSRRPSYGWGGAMGPAQFIPSTWVGYRERVSEVTGNVPPSPWNLEDAFAASSIKLAAGGATAQNERAEWKAAMLYFAGGNWDNPTYAFYGDAVEDLTSRYNAMIQILEEDIAASEAEESEGIEELNQ